jgi:DNA-binding MarR family transcriptional regulator
MSANPSEARPSRGPAVPVRPGADVRALAGRVLDTVPTVMDALRRAMRRHVDGDTSVPQFRCLNYVARRPGCTVGEVAAFLGVTMPTASATVDRLVRAGMLRARPDADDRRRLRLEPTEAGRERLERIRRGAQDDLSVSLAALDDDERATVDAALAILRRLGRGG